MDEGAFGRAAQERAIAEVEVEMARLCELLAEGLAMGVDGGREMVGGAMSEFLVEFFGLVRAEGPRPGVREVITLPLLVHGAETGAPGPAMPVAVLHLLWWASARHLDDLTSAGAPSPAGAAAGGRVLTALAVGGQLPGRLIAGMPVGAAVRAALADELSRAWVDAVDGRLRDLAERAPNATCESVLRGYEGRTGAPYAMAAASAARLAGADDHRVAGWRAYGRAFGVLCRLADDRRDLVSGRHEGLAAGTATHLLVHLLAGLPPARRREALALHASARHSASARAEMAAWMLDEEVAESHAASVAPLAGRAHGLLDMLGGDPGCVRELHRAVEGTVGHLPGLPLAAA
ncbi:hypothetical protein AB0C69_13215 [Actinomadura sp. NPDC048032]|uniref:hypothetical protein n=1 Tax=Actinomadura sp. NPDC048032 TaxID=3155747 RepID=UPI0033C34C46